jgi:CRISPR-associated protein Cas2
MSLTIVITRDVQDRYRGYLRSAMLEVDAGVYVSSRLNRDVRDRLWDVLAEWFGVLSRGSIVMIWRDRDAASNIGMKTLGIPRREITDVDDLLLTRRELSSK